MSISKPSRKQAVIAGSAVLALALAGTGIGIAQAHNTVALTVDGQTQEVSGFSRDVADVLQASGVEVGEHDQVVPAADSPVEDGSTISVTHAKSYTVSVDGKAVQTWSTADSAAMLLADIDASGRGATVAADRSQARGALAAAGTEGTVAVHADGKTTKVPVSAQDDVNAILAAAKVDVSPIDQVTYSTGADGTLALNVTRVVRGTQTEEVRTPAEEQRVDDPDLDEGTETVVDEGAEGIKTVSHYIQKAGDKVLVDIPTGETVTQEMKPKVIHVGTKVAAPAATAASSSSSAPAAESSSAGGDVWAALAQCESGGNPATNTGNGFYGMYQFTLSTWQSMGGSGLPSDASAAEQTQRAQALQAAAGWGQWPACAASLGLY